MWPICLPLGYLGTRPDGTAQHSSFRFTSWPGGNPHLEGKAPQLLNSSCWQSVPYWDGSGEEAEFETVGRRRVLLELGGVCCSCLLAGWYQVSEVWYGCQVVYNFEEESKLQLCSSGFMCLPSKVIQHIRHAIATRISVSACHKSGCPTLHHLHLVFLVSLMRVPDGAAVVYVWSDHWHVSLILGFFAGLSQITCLLKMMALSSGLLNNLPLSFGGEIPVLSFLRDLI